MANLHIVSHTHWDREWYLTFQQFHLKLVHLVDRLLDLLARDADYLHFTLDGQMIILEDYLEMRPDRFEALCRYIQSGRVFVGPWYIQPDEFLVSPEATIRNLLEGDRVSRRFGPKMMVGYAPDCFGHIGQMPQILAGFGIQHACLQRGLDEEPCELYWQAPDGSRVLLSYLRDGYGNGQALLFTNRDSALAEINRVSQSLLPHTASDQVLILQGTDHMEPVLGTSQGIRDLQTTLEGQRVLHSSLPEYFAALQKEICARNLSLPVVTGELRSPHRAHMLPGVLSTRMWIKQRNQQVETLLERWAEPYSTVASLLQKQNPLSTSPLNPGWTERANQPSDLLHQAWRILMRCHPHDSICGCAIDQVHEEMRPRFAEAEQIGTEITSQSLKAICMEIDTQKVEPDHAISSLVVFNPLSFPRTDRVEVSLQLADGAGGIAIHAEDGSIVPYEVLESTVAPISNFDLTRRELLGMVGLFQSGQFGGSVTRDIAYHQAGNEVWVEIRMASSGLPNTPVVRAALDMLDRMMQSDEVENFHIRIAMLSNLRVVFTAEDVPACGYRVFWVSPAEVKSPEMVPEAPQNQIENEFYRVEVERTDGTLRIVDKQTGAVYSGLNRFIDGGDKGDLYNYCPPENDRMIAAELVDAAKTGHSIFAELTVTYQLDVPASLSTDRSVRTDPLERITIRSQIRLAPGVKRVDVHTEVDNTARDHRLRVHFPAPFAISSADYDGHFEVVHRPVGLPAFDSSWIEEPRPEVPQRCFTDISDGETGLMLAARGLPEVEAISFPDGRSELALTLLRCTGWLSRPDLSNRRGEAGPSSLETPLAQMPGKWSFDYAILPHAGDWRNAARMGWGFSTPLRAEPTGIHPGNLPCEQSFVSIDHPDFIITALKAAEDRQGWILRGVNLANQDIQVGIAVKLPFTQVRMSRMDETELSDILVQPGEPVSITVRAHEVVTLKFIQDAPF